MESQNRKKTWQQCQEKVQNIHRENLVLDGIHIQKSDRVYNLK